MGSLWRVVILLSFTWLSMQGVQAHAYPQVDDAASSHGSTIRPHAHDAQRVAHDAQLAAVSCADESADAATSGQPTSKSGHRHQQHGHCACCVTGCGVHCGALLAAFSFSAQAPDHGLPRTHPVTRYDGVTRAPPVRPPIV
ncbi:hypothetical protein [Paraburkholderia jirisanensis]